MKINLSRNAGFCPGVKRADIEIRKLIKNKRQNEHIYTIGKLIHNDSYNRELEGLGVKTIEIQDADDIVKTHSTIPITFVIRTHGITKENLEKLTYFTKIRDNIRLINLTCPSVEKIHKIATDNTGDNTVFLLFCDKKHPEAIGTMSYANGEKYMISSEDELKKIDFKSKIPILCAQTTENLEIFIKLKKFLKNLCTNAKIFDTICNVTENRQNEALSLAKVSDMMIIIGGKESSNTRKLYELCRSECPNSRWIESAEELLTDFPGRIENVGITAGASTPDGIITEVLKVMETKDLDFGTLLEDTLKTLHT